MQARLTWADRIRAALADDRFVLNAQPILALGDDQVPRYELLIRMLGDGDDLIPPGDVPVRRRAVRPDPADRSLGAAARDRAPRRRRSDAGRSSTCRSTCPPSRWPIPSSPTFVAQTLARGGDRRTRAVRRDHRDGGDRQPRPRQARSRSCSRSSAARSRSTTSAPASRPSTTSSTWRSTT